VAIPHANPSKFWKKVEEGFVQWEVKWSPVRWRPWKDVFCGREGFYVLLRCGVLAGALAVVSVTSWNSAVGVILRIAAISVTILFLCDIMIVHGSIAFVTRKPANLLRSAVLTIFSFFQIPLSFAIFYLCKADCFNSTLAWDRSLYFSVVTATTLGYGDIVPKPEASLVQFLIVAELFTSVAFLSVLVARLIALAKVPGEQGPGGLKRHSGEGP